MAMVNSGPLTLHDILQASANAYAETANNTAPPLIQQRVIETINELYGPAAPAVALKPRQYHESKGETERGSANLALTDHTTRDIATTSTDPNSQYREWIANIRVEKYALSGPFFIHIFVGNFSSDPFDWSFESNLVGTHSIFAKASRHDCVSCQTNQQITGTMPLTQRLRTDVQEGMLNSLEVVDVQGYLQENLSWRVSLVCGLFLLISLSSPRLFKFCFGALDCQNTLLMIRSFRSVNITHQIC